jgi:hypothetical protein
MGSDPNVLRFPRHFPISPPHPSNPILTSLRQHDHVDMAMWTWPQTDMAADMAMADFERASDRSRFWW